MTCSLLGLKIVNYVGRLLNGKFFLMQSGNPTLVRIASCIHYIYMCTLAEVIGVARGIFKNQILKKKIRFLEKKSRFKKN